MSTTTAPLNAASRTSSFSLSTGLPSSIPHFTADDGCLDATNIWYGSRPCDIGTGFNREQGWCNAFLWDYAGGTEALPTSELATKECYPNERHAATRCPESYTNAGGNIEGSMDSDGNDLWSKETLFCCPEAHYFRINRSATLKNQNGDIATVDATQCVARTLSLDGDNPYKLTISSWTSDSDDAPILTTKTATFDTDSNLLFASVVTVSYEVIPSINATCAPNCEHPWTGGEWPIPTEDVSDYEPTESPNDSSLRGLAPLMIAGITVGSFVGLVIVVGVTWCLIRRNKKKKRAAEAQVQAERERPREGSNKDEAAYRKPEAGYSVEH